MTLCARRRLLCFVAALTLLALALPTPLRAGAVPWPDGEPPSLPVGVQRLQADAYELHFSLHIPAYEIDATGNLSAAGLNRQLAVPGAPALPYYSTLIALPPEGEARISVAVAGPVSEQRLSLPLRPAPGAPALPALPAAGPRPPQWPTSAHALATDYGGRIEPFPPERYRLSEPKYYRDVRYLQLDLFPLQYRPASGRLTHAAILDISVTFTAPPVARHPLVNGKADLWPIIGGQLLNPEQAQAWRSLPTSPAAPASRLPVGRPTYKIEVAADGIYALSGAALAAAGMDLASVDPATVAMLYRGEPVALTFHDQNGDGHFDKEDAIYFYGWAFAGPRSERQFITNNVFWLWAGGEGQRLAEAANPAGAPLLTAFRETITREEENYYLHTYTDQWEQFPNEPDSWYWQIITRPGAALPTPQTVTHTVTLPDPAVEGAPAHVTAEYLSARYPAGQLHEVMVSLNGASAAGSTRRWRGLQNVNVETTVPASTLVDGLNEAATTVTSANSTPTAYYLNRISVAYDRRLRAVDGRLIFTDADPPHTYKVGGFDEGDYRQMLVWDISDPRLPRRVPLSAAAVGGSGPYTYTFSTARGSGATAERAAFIITAAAKIREPVRISRYLPPSLEPVAGGAEWLAITHPLFRTQVERLAAHRRLSAYGGLQTQVVQIEEVINQYGYGLPLPAAIHDFVAHALATWEPAPAYLLLVGDATINPRQLTCVRSGSDCGFWGVGHDPNLVPTDILFVDPLMGTVISDHSFALLSGSDLVPEVAVGRLAVQTPEEAENAIAKIMARERALLAPASWQTNALFLADDADSGGDFCPANDAMRPLLPSTTNQVHLCLAPVANEPEDYALGPTTITTGSQALRSALGQWVNGPGVSLVSYRGHAAVNDWGGLPAPFLKIPSEREWMLWEQGVLHQRPQDDRSWWQNAGKFPIVVSFSCLDGNFAFPGVPGLSEAFLTLPGAGSAAAWASTGLGFEEGHDVLQEQFYRAVYEEQLNVLGDAIVRAKMMYDMSLNEQSALYTYTLHGDPAMRLLRLDAYRLYLPTIGS